MSFSRIGCLLLACMASQARAVTIEAYVKPFTDVSVCPITHELFDACTGRRAYVIATQGVNLNVNPCHPVMLGGFWGASFKGCPVFFASSATATAPVCYPQPGLRAESQTPTLDLFTWDPVPCVNSYDSVYFLGRAGTPLSMEQFHCALDKNRSVSFPRTARLPVRSSRCWCEVRRALLPRITTVLPAQASCAVRPTIALSTWFRAPPPPTQSSRPSSTPVLLP